MIVSAAGSEGCTAFLYSILWRGIYSVQAPCGLLGLKRTQTRAEGEACFLNDL